MRNVLWLTILLLAVAPVGCKSKSKPHVAPPAAVLQTLRTLYPRAIADSTRWEWDKDGYFEGHFRLDGLPHKLRTDSVGRYIETEVDVARTALPAALQDTLQAQIDRTHNPKLFRVRQVSEVRMADGHTEYEAQVRVDNKWHKRYYDEKGTLLRERRIKKG